MISIKNKSEIQKMEMAGSLLAEIVAGVSALIVPGISTLEIDDWIAKELRAKNLVSATMGFMGYRHSSCISINDEVVHGIPAKNKILVLGDLVKIDVCASWQNYCADMARCFFVGQPADSTKKLVQVTQKALDAGIEQAIPGNYLSDISFAIQKEIEKHSMGIVRDFAGHGIGKRMHEEPEILNYGEPGRGPILKSGMTFAIEPMTTLGDYKVFITNDKWTVKTKDKSMAAHIEDTVLITDNGPKILTRSNTIGVAI